MRLFLKFAFAVIGTLLALALAVGLYVQFSFDPNDYKGRMAAWVKAHTGRELRMDGPISLSFVPWLGVHLHNVTLGNAPGFDARPLMHVAAADVGVRLLPLLEDGRIEARTLSLQGLELNLQVDGRGRGNWEGMTGAAGAAKGDAAAAAAPRHGALFPSSPETAAERLDRWVAAAAIGGIDIRDARVRWDDPRRHIDVSHLRLSTAAILPRKPFALRGGADVAAPGAGVDGHFDIHGMGLVDPAAGSYGIDDLHLAVVASGSAIPVKPSASGKLRGRLRYDARHQIITLTDIDGEALNATVHGRIKAEQLAESPALLGSLQVERIDVRKAVDMFREHPILTEDSDVLGSATAKFGFDINSLRANVRYIHVEMDDSVINGAAQVADFAHPRTTFRMFIDKLDLDRYLPPAPADAAGPAAATPGAAAAVAAGRLPVALLRRLDLDGEVGVGALKATGLHVSDLKLPLRARGGVVSVQPQAKLYGGRYHGHIDLDARAADPRLSFDEHLDGVRLGPLLADVIGKTVVSGMATVHARFTCLAGPRLVPSLDGKAHFDVHDGAVNGVDLPWLVAVARAKLRGRPAPPAATEQHTAFTALSGTLAARDGRVTNDDLTGEAPNLRLAGKGSLDLASRRLDYVTDVTFVDGRDPGGAEVADLRGVTVPVHIGGTLDEPRFAPDVRGLVKQHLEGRLEKALGGAGGPAVDALKGRVQRTLDRLLGHP